MNFIWLLDDLTADNGATEVVPGGNCPEDPSQPPLERALPLTAPAGTAVAFEGRVWHQIGRNRSEAPRAAAFAWYVGPICRTEVLGTVYGHSPR